MNTSLLTELCAIGDGLLGDTAGESFSETAVQKVADQIAIDHMYSIFQEALGMNDIDLDILKKDFRIFGPRSVDGMDHVIVTDVIPGLELRVGMLPDDLGDITVVQLHNTTNGTRSPLIPVSDPDFLKLVAVQAKSQLRDTFRSARYVKEYEGFYSSRPTPPDPLVVFDEDNNVLWRFWFPDRTSNSRVYALHVDVNAVGTAYRARFVLSNGQEASKFLSFLAAESSTFTTGGEGISMMANISYVPVPVAALPEVVPGIAVFTPGEYSFVTDVPWKFMPKGDFGLFEKWYTSATLYLTKLAIWRKEEAQRYGDF